eukprot:3067277-Pyramimonas_sp.AAC.1
MFLPSITGAGRWGGATSSLNGCCGKCGWVSTSSPPSWRSRRSGSQPAAAGRAPSMGCIKPARSTLSLIHI